MLVNGKKQCPSASADQEKWDLDQEMAAGLIASTLEPGQCVQIQGLEDDLVKMWEALCCVYVLLNNRQALISMLMMRSSTFKNNLIRRFSR